MTFYDADCQMTRIALNLKGKESNLVYHEGFLIMGDKEVIHPKL